MPRPPFEPKSHPPDHCELLGLLAMAVLKNPTYERMTKAFVQALGRFGPVARAEIQMFDPALDQFVTVAHFGRPNKRSPALLPFKVPGDGNGRLVVTPHSGQNFCTDLEEVLRFSAMALGLAIANATHYDTLSMLAGRDALTGIANHRALQEALAKALEDAEKSGSEVGVVMIDVDHFRKFNEDHGHLAGDQVLKSVAGAIQSQIEPGCLAARYGGEEFTVVLPGHGPKQTARVAEKIRIAVRSISCQAKSEVTASLGWSCFPHHGKEAAPLLHAADDALYAAKRAGRDRTVGYAMPHAA